MRRAYAVALLAVILIGCPKREDSRKASPASAPASQAAKIVDDTADPFPDPETVVLEPWGQQMDVYRTRALAIQSARYEYMIRQGGNVDGDRCRFPNGHTGVPQEWESNRMVRMENIGDGDIINPWLSNGRNNVRSVDEILASILGPDMTEQEKALAIWWFINRNCHAASIGDQHSEEIIDVIKILNVYGYTLCHGSCQALGKLWEEAGLKSRRASTLLHSAYEVFADGDWRLMDAYLNTYYLLRDNKTVASADRLLADFDLFRRGHAYGTLHPDVAQINEEVGALFVPRTQEVPQWQTAPAHSLNMTLRPGEAIAWRWGYQQPYRFHGQDPREQAKAGDSGYGLPETLCNGVWTYRPRLDAAAPQGTEKWQDVVAGENGLTAAPGKRGVVTWRMRLPYVIIGGNLAHSGKQVRLDISWDNESWQELADDLKLDPCFLPDQPARYEYYLRCRIGDDGVLSNLVITNIFQSTRLSLPGMRVGDNAFCYSDQSLGERKVRIEHHWVERTVASIPEPPALPNTPPDGAVMEGSLGHFTWTPSADHTARILAWHYELSEYPDMRWPLSPLFTAVLNADREGTGIFPLDKVGLLNPGQTYYWRVRPMTRQGIWGSWSATWKVTAQGPGVPLNLALVTDEKQGTATLKWQPNSAGRKPVKYQVYGSDFKGFAPSQVPYAPILGSAKTDLPTTCPANLLDETRETSLQVVGPAVTLANANTAYYRVVAVDEKNVASGPSDPVSLPTPFVCGAPPPGKAGTAYTCPLRVIRSLGDLKYGSPYPTQGDWVPSIPGFWQVERPAFSLDKGPDWMKIDPATGVISGTPPSAGTFQATVKIQVDLLPFFWGEPPSSRTTSRTFAVVVTP